MPDNILELYNHHLKSNKEVTISAVHPEARFGEMTLAGNGDLLKKFEELKNKLMLEGLFDQDKKKPIPKFPQKIGIVTAPTGAAIRDILSTIKRRYPLCETILFPSSPCQHGSRLLS